MSSDSASKIQRDMGRRLAAVRSAKGVTQEQLAEIVCFGVTTISSWESGRNRIDVVALAKAAEILGFTTDYVMRGDFGGLRLDLARQLEQLQSENIPVKKGRPRQNSNPERAKKNGLQSRKRS